jgi:CDP-diacylglycerol--serine O-phosphatidyltransferase
MVSTIKYQSFKKPELFRKMNFNALVAAILLMIFIAALPPIALFLIGTGYVSSGIVNAVCRYWKLKSKPLETPNKDDQEALPIQPK